MNEFDHVTTEELLEILSKRFVRMVFCGLPLANKEGPGIERTTSKWKINSHLEALGMADLLKADIMRAMVDQPPQ